MCVQLELFSQDLLQNLKTILIVKKICTYHKAFLTGIACIITGRIGYGQFYQVVSVQERSGFQWPEGIKMGLSLTFDDGRLSQIDTGTPLLDMYGVKAIFYLSPGNTSGFFQDFQLQKSARYSFAIWNATEN